MNIRWECVYLEATLGKRTEGRVSLMRTALVNSKNRKKKKHKLGERKGERWERSSKK